MTIEQVKSQVTQRDLNTKSVYVKLLSMPNLLRLVGIGRVYLSVLTSCGVHKIDPATVSQVIM